MRVRLVDYTGVGSADPARHAANVLVFTKNTRLEMGGDRWEAVCAMPWERLKLELDYMARTIPSSWEFLDYTFLLENVTRGFTHQLVRTRTASYAQQSMRVTNQSNFKYEYGHQLLNNPEQKKAYDEAMDIIRDNYENLLSSGASMEDARGILPTNICTNIVVKANLRTLADTFRKRESVRTQDEYRVAVEMMKDAVLAAHPFTAMFFHRSFDVAARELQSLIMMNITDAAERAAMIKLLDEMRKV